MYVPSHFAVTELHELHLIIQQNPFGALVTHDANGLNANHLPFEFDSSTGTHGLLTAHVARANDVWQCTSIDVPVMVIFRGPAAYISPNWYPSKHEAHRQVPTWNYEVVHAHGVMRVIDQDRFVRRNVALLTRRHESGEPIPWKMGDAPQEFVDQLMTMIVGVEIEITRLEGKRKLSQNKEPRDRNGAIDGLQSKGELALASAMLRTQGV